MLAIQKLMSIHWTGLRVLAAVVVVVGLWGTVSGLTEVVAKSGAVGTTASNPVVDPSASLGMLRQAQHFGVRL